MTELSNLHELFLPELKRIASGSKEWSVVMTKFENAASSESLRIALTAYNGAAKCHLTLLMDLLASFDTEQAVQHCAAMAGIAEEAAATLCLHAKHAKSDVRDSALIFSAQKALHYKICVYGTLRAWADRMGLEDAARAFDQILHDVRTADERLTDIADSINPYGHVGPGFISHSPARPGWIAGRVGGIAQGARP